MLTVSSIEMIFIHLSSRKKSRSELVRHVIREYEMDSSFHGSLGDQELKNRVSFIFKLKGKIQLICVATLSESTKWVAILNLIPSAIYTDLCLS